MAKSKESLLQVFGEITKVNSMSNRSLRITFDTQENMTDEQVMKVMAWHEKHGYMLFASENRKVKPEDVINLPDAPVGDDDEKTPSQRLRARMYVYFKKTHGKDDGFETWYRDMLEKFGNRFLDKMDSRV